MLTLIEKPLANDKPDKEAEMMVDLSMLLLLVLLSALGMLGSLWFVDVLVHTQINALNPAGVGAL